eukprot:4015505-Alexandrium_andersonii.AAC.1
MASWCSRESFNDAACPLCSTHNRNSTSIRSTGLCNYDSSSLMQQQFAAHPCERMLQTQALQHRRPHSGQVGAPGSFEITTTP